MNLRIPEFTLDRGAVVLALIVALLAALRGLGGTAQSGPGHRRQSDRQGRGDAVMDRLPPTLTAAQIAARITPTTTPEEAFQLCMIGRSYGPCETADARAWFMSGWYADSARVNSGTTGELTKRGPGVVL